MDGSHPLSPESVRSAWRNASIPSCRLHPASGMFRRLDHVGFAVRDLGVASALFRDALNAMLGDVFEDPIQQVRICFAEYEGGRVELIAPLGPDSPVNRIVAEGGGTYHLCYETDDLQRAVDGLRRAGFVPTGLPQPAVAFGGRRVVFLVHPIARLIELVET